MPASLVYSKSVHKVFITLVVEYALCFVLCHNLRLHMPKTCGIGKTFLSVSCARFKSHFWKSRPFPTLRQRNICICPCLSRSTQISRLCPFFSVPGHFAERHFAERHFAERHFADRHFAERTFCRQTCALSRTDILSNGQYDERTFRRKDILPKRQLPENREILGIVTHFSKMCNSQSL